MAGEYQVRLYDNTTGALTAIFDDWNSLYYFRRLNDYGYHTFSIDGEDPRIPLFKLDTLIQVMRRDRAADIPWYEEYIAFQRTGVYQVTDRGRVIFSSYGRGLEDLLHRRHILWRPGDPCASRAGFEGELQSGPADDCMKLYVYENISSAATKANGRMADGNVVGISTDPTTGSAPAWEGRRAYKNLLAVIQEISEARLVDFDVTWSAPGGVLAFRFHTYYPQRGTDRTGAGSAAPVVFSIDRANMSAPYLTQSRMEEITAVYVLGQGEGSSRVFVERTNTAEMLVSPWNRIEFTHDARNETTQAALIALGDGHLAEHGFDQHLSFQVSPSQGTVYGREYFLGDLVAGRFLGVSENRKVTGIENTVSEGRESMRIHFGGE